MFLHIGESRIVFKNELIGIFNIKIKDKEDNRQFLEFASNEDDYKKIDSEESKSFVVTTNGVYFSPISSNTLAKREKKMSK